MNHRCELLEEKGLEIKRSAFVVPVIWDDQFPDRPLTIFVHNPEEVREPPDTGVKPAGFGGPGGKVKPGEDPCEAALREVKQETGLINPLRIEEARLEHFLALHNPGSLDRYIHCWDFRTRKERGSLEVNGNEMHQGFVHIFMAEFDWKLSPLRQEFLRLLEGLNDFPDHAFEEGLIFKIRPEFAKQMGIVEAGEKKGRGQEIDALALFPLLSIPKIPHRILRFNEVTGKREHWDFHLSHLKRVSRVIGMLNL